MPRFEVEWMKTLEEIALLNFATEEYKETSKTLNNNILFTASLAKTK